MLGAMLLDNGLLAGIHTDAALDNAAFPWFAAREIRVTGTGGVRALRVTYTGELGWELHLPMAAMPAVYEALVAAGAPLGLVHVGAAALDSMRMEKAYRSGREIGAGVTPAEAGLTRFARPDGFQGAVASLAPPSRWKLALLRLDEPEGGAEADPHGSESVWQDGACVGTVSSAAFGYAVGACLGWAWLKPAAAVPGSTVEILVLGKPRRAVVVEGALRDPKNGRPRRDTVPA